MYGLTLAPGFDARMGVPVVLVLIFGAIVWGIHDSGRLISERKAREAMRVEALNAWMADCPHATDQCALSWDESYTLRDIYIKRVSGQ